MHTKSFGQLLTSDAAARLVAFRNTVAAAFPGSVQDVILFGSRARGDAAPDSDFDVAVVLADGQESDRDVRRQLADAAWEHVIDGYPIVPIVLTAGELAEGRPTRTELGARVATEGISIE